jgi:hypothetical protein
MLSYFDWSTHPALCPTNCTAGYWFRFLTTQVNFAYSTACRGYVRSPHGGHALLGHKARLRPLSKQHPVVVVASWDLRRKQRKIESRANRIKSWHAAQATMSRSVDPSELGQGKKSIPLQTKKKETMTIHNYAQLLSHNGSGTAIQDNQ